MANLMASSTFTLIFSMTFPNFVWLQEHSHMWDEGQGRIEILRKHLRKSSSDISHFFGRQTTTELNFKVHSHMNFLYRPSPLFTAFLLLFYPTLTSGECFSDWFKIYSLKNTIAELQSHTPEISAIPLLLVLSTKKIISLVQLGRWFFWGESGTKLRSR